MLEALSVLFELVKNFPEFFTAILEVKDLWEKHLDQEKRDAQVALLKQEILNAQSSKDTSKLKAVVDSIISGQPIPPVK